MGCYDLGGFIHHWLLALLLRMERTALMAKALEVRVGLQAVSEGMLPFPPTYRLEVPQTSESGLQVESLSEIPILVVPMKCREDPLGMTCGSTPFK